MLKRLKRFVLLYLPKKALNTAILPKEALDVETIFKGSVGRWVLKLLPLK